MFRVKNGVWSAGGGEITEKHIKSSKIFMFSKTKPWIRISVKFFYIFNIVMFGIE